MLFGSTEHFGIEIGEVLKASFDDAVQFGMWIQGSRLGDWEDRISLRTSVHYMRLFLRNAEHRMVAECDELSAADVFERLYEDYYERGDYAIPDLRDKHHLDDVGCGALLDKYGIVVVATSEVTERVIAKDFRMGSDSIRRNTIVADVRLARGTVDRIGAEYVAWGRSREQQVKSDMD